MFLFQNGGFGVELIETGDDVVDVLFYLRSGTLLELGEFGTEDILVQGDQLLSKTNSSRWIFEIEVEVDEDGGGSIRVGVDMIDEYCKRVEDERMR